MNGSNDDPSIRHSVETPSGRPLRRRFLQRPAGRALAAIVAAAGCARAQAPPSGQPSLPSSDQVGHGIESSAKVEPPLRPRPVYASAFFDVEVEGQPLRMAYRDVSPEGARESPVVVLLHGKNFSGFYWEPTIRELVAKGFRVVAPDQIGFGASSKPDIHYTFHLLARTTAQWLDHLGISKAFVVGHSMGGMLATRFALMYPERVARLVLEDPIGLEDYRTLVRYTPVDEQFREEVAATYESILVYQKNYYLRWRPEYEVYVADQAQWLGSGEWPRVAKASALTYEMIYTQPVLYELDRVRVPTLLVVGQNDRTVVGKAKLPEEFRAMAGNYPELGKRAHEAMPGSRLVEIPACGHIPHVEAHQAFMAAILQWFR